MPRDLYQLEEIALGSNANHRSDHRFCCFLPTYRPCTQCLAHYTHGKRTTGVPSSHHTKIIGPYSAAVSVFPYAKLHMRSLQICFHKQFRPHKHSQLRFIWLLVLVRDSLMWWTLAENIFQVALFLLPLLSSVLMTDTSLSWWGAHFVEKGAWGLWTPD